MGIVFICAWQTLNGQMSLAYFLMFVLFSFVIFGSVENINDAAHMLGLIDSAMNKLDVYKRQDLHKGITLLCLRTGLIMLIPF